jgi:hypothetical protein
VSRAEISSEHQVIARDEQREPHRAVGAPRLVPAVSFGLRAAVLAGVVVVACPVAASAASQGGAAGTAVMTTVGLRAPISALTGPDDTSCCPPGDQN